ncbi:exosome complex exonuclease RRP46 homolog [Mangifera indica]|uniref:exosome complex exonuclease RRP46 homolog n=1 Tax=Mangifera indica TaxID=29780 RepID=UPI001CFA66F2|nr:exosome complex exonuclease RRP46 homolog [Mangifera indica]
MSALVDAGIPMKHLPVAICCWLAESRYVILDHTKLEEQKMKAFAYLVFPNSVLSVLRKGLSLVEDEPMEHGIITSVTHGVQCQWTTIFSASKEGMLRVQRCLIF